MYYVDKTFTTKARLLGAIPCVHVFLQDLLQSKQDSGDISTVIHTIRILASSSEFSVALVWLHQTESENSITLYFLY